MKKKCALVLVLATFLMSGCSSGSKTSIESGVATTESTETEATTIETSVTTTTSTTETFEDFEINTLGVLYRLDKKPTVSSVSMRITGDFTDYNNQSPSQNGIRCIFEIEELIFVTIECPFKEDNLYVKLFRHNTNSAYYREQIYIPDDMDEIFAKADYNDKGSLSVVIHDTENVAPGYYDVVFIDGNKPCQYHCLYS